MSTAVAPNPEATAAAVIQRKDLAPPAGAHAPVIEGIRKIQKEQNPEAALQHMQKPGGLDEKRIVDSRDNHIQGSGDIKPDPLTGKMGRELTPTEKNLRLDAQKFAEAANKYLKGELRFTATPTPGSTEELIVHSVRDAIKDLDPTFATALSGLSTAEVNENIIDILKDPKMATQVKALLEQATDPQKAISTEVISRIRTELSGAKEKEALKKIDLDAKDREVDAAQKAVDEFKDHSGTGGLKGARVDDLAKYTPAEVAILTTGKAAAEKTIREKTAEIRAKEAEFQRARSITDTTVRSAETTRISGEITNANNDLRGAENDLIEANGKLTEYSNLNTAKQNAEKELQQLQKQRDVMGREHAGLQNASLEAQANLDGAQINIEKAQEDYVKSLKNIFTEGAQKFARADFEEKHAINKQHLEKTRDEATNKAEKIIADGLLTRWDNTTGKGEKYDTKGIEKEYMDMLTRRTADGPKPLLKAMLIRGGMSATEADTWLANKEFVDKMAPQVVEQLMLRRLQTKGITADEAEVIVQTPWGENAINGAIAKNKKIAETIANLQKDGVLREKTFMESLQKMDPKKKAMWLAIIFGGLIGIAVNAAHGVGLI